jgi:hypothetical protein
MKFLTPTIAICFLTGLQTTVAFSPPTQNIFNAITDFLQDAKSITTNSNAGTAAQREELKNELLAICNDESIQGKAEQRRQVEEVISKLKDVSPVKDAARSPLLQKKWLLLWTTEKEINIFSDWNISGQITQSLQNGKIENTIPFIKGGSFSIVGSAMPESNNTDDDDSGIRTEFQFETASLDLAKWGTYTIPPIGTGWFDTVYLDDNFRVDLNSRDDILIVQC